MVFIFFTSVVFGGFDSCFVSKNRAQKIENTQILMVFFLRQQNLADLEGVSYLKNRVQNVRNTRIFTVSLYKWYLVCLKAVLRKFKKKAS